MTIYNHKEIEKKWQAQWAKDNIYHASDDGLKPKKFVLIEFPYPSGEGLHMGHLRPFLAGDIYSRFCRMSGFETMYPIGWDAFGLPAENFAIKKGVHPRISTAKNIENAKRQLQSWGTSFDWDREVNTTDPEYYKWTQWIFLQFYKAGLAYEATGLINWCPKDKTGLANEEVIDGKCERCGTVVEKKEMKQWYLKITDYADKLLAGLDQLDWPEPIKQMQRNWIGRSEGAEIEFVVDNNFLILPGWNSDENENYYPWLSKKLEAGDVGVKTFVYPKAEEHTEEEIINEVLLKNTFNENTVVVGHSLGSVVALKTIEKLKKPIAKVVLAGGFLKPDFKDKPRPFEKTFKWQFDFDKIRKNVKEIVILHDTEDHIVPESAADDLMKQLGGKLIKFKANSKHIKGKEEPQVLEAAQNRIKVFTTRPDTLFGATYMVLAPEHSLVEQLTTRDQEKYVHMYVHKSAEKSELERTSLEKEKTGEFTGSFAINPATKEKIPIWIADYVLSSYGTGAIMAVPAHDKRDYEFAKKYDLGIVRVINDEGDRRLPYERDGRLMNSGKYDTISSATARSQMTSEFGVAKIQFKLRDWVFSRQRYWGEPIPIIHCQKCGTVPVPDKDLPVKLPEVEKYEPTGTGESPLATIDSWVNVKCPNCGSNAKRETNTMPQWAGSSWYWLRYTDPANAKEFAGKKMQKHWTPVDLYFGGMEHTTLHLLYARFWNLFLYDQGLAVAKEPFQRRVPHGIILGPDGEKMSKSRGNVVNPDEIVEKFGADTLRMFEPFLGPHEATVPWNDQGIVGVKRFLDKVWRYQQVFEPGDDNNHIQKLIKKITSDIQNFKFNTAVSAFMEFLNENKELSKENWDTFLILLSPFAPHMTEELWHQQGHKDSVHAQAWPKYDERYVRDEAVTVVVQVLGRVRASLSVPAGTTQEQIREQALADANVKKHLNGKEILKEVFVQDKLINFVTK